MDRIEISSKQANRIKKKSSWFVGTTHDIGDITRIKKNIEEFPFFAYIIHDKDENKTRHIHFVVNCRGSRSIKSICETLECDYQDVQDCHHVRSCIRYLIHADDLDKYQYNREEIISNNSDRVDFYFNSISFSVKDIYSDLILVKNGTLTAYDFISKYNSEFANLPFYQKIKTLEVIDKMSKV